MIDSAKQLGEKIRIVDDRGNVIERRGFLISFTKTKVSYINDRKSKVVLVVDDRGKYIHSFNVSKEFSSGLGW